MARALRLEYPGACYHVINRGNYRSDLFAGEGAAESFERTLFEACTRFGWRLHAYVVMSNHFHLALETPQPNLSAGMKWLQGTWVSRFNRFRTQVGRPFQGRFKALHVQAGHALAQVAHYIHLNPVRAKVVSIERLFEFRWSSLHHFRQKNRPVFFEPKTVLVESGGLADTPAGWDRYAGYTEDVMSRLLTKAAGPCATRLDPAKDVMSRLLTKRPGPRATRLEYRPYPRSENLQWRVGE